MVDLRSKIHFFSVVVKVHIYYKFFFIYGFSNGNFIKNSLFL